MTRLYEADAIGQSTVDQAASEVKLAGSELAAANAQVIAARAGLAQLIGVPSAAIDTLSDRCDRRRRMRMDGAEEPRGAARHRPAPPL